jgi:hypothetical protein
MPRFEKGSKEAMEWSAMMRERRGKKEKPIEGEGKLTKLVLDAATKIGTKAGEPFKNSVGVNPFTLGYDLGEKVIAPALMKRFPPKKRRGKGMEPANRDLTPEMTGEGMGGDYCECNHCSGMGILKKKMN